MCAAASPVVSSRQQLCGVTWVFLLSKVIKKYSLSARCAFLSEEAKDEGEEEDGDEEDEDGDGDGDEVEDEVEVEVAEEQDQDEEEQKEEEEQEEQEDAEEEEEDEKEQEEEEAEEEKDEEDEHEDEEGEQDEKFLLLSEGGVRRCSLLSSRSVRSLRAAVCGAEVSYLLLSPRCLGCPAELLQCRAKRAVFSADKERHELAWVFYSSSQARCMKVRSTMRLRLL